MKECQVIGIIGNACRKQGGSGLGSCQARQECIADPGLTRDEILEIAPECEFVRSGQVPPGQSGQSPAPTTKL